MEPQHQTRNEKLPLDVLANQPGLILSYRKDNQYYKCTFCEGSLGEKIGIVPKEATGKMLHDLFSRDEIDYMAPFLEEAWTGRPTTYKGTSPDGQIHYIAHLMPVRNPETDGPQDVIVSFSDISSFANRIKETESLDREKNIFWRNVNSEIRTPMNSVSGILSLLMETPLDENQRYYVNIIQESFNHLISTFDELLSFSKLETEGAPLESNEFNFKELIEGVLEGLVIQADKKHIDLNVHYSDDLPEMVIGDQERFRQLIYNFTQRLINVMPEDGGIEVRVASCPSGVEGALKYEVAFTTYDKKTGENRILDLKDMSSIQFAVAMRLVKMMKGKVFEKQEGGRQWVTFDLELARAGKKSQESTKIKPVGKLAGGSILYVAKQNSQGRDTAIEMLKKEGCQVIYQYSEHAVIEAMVRAAKNGKPFQGLIIDDDAIELSSLELMREVKATKETSKVSVFVLLPKVKQKQERIFLKYGAAAVVVRPIADEALWRLMLDTGAVKTSAPTTESTSPTTTPAEKPFQLWASILVAEDNAVNRMMAEKVLEKMGCTVTSVVNGRQALEAAQEKGFDLILMDCQMPEMDGYDAASAIKSLVEAGAMPNVPIIALTAQTGREDRERCIQAGMDNYLSKPVSLTRLKEVLQMYLKHRMVP